MSAWLIIAVGVVYAGIAVDNFINKNYAMAITFGGYAFSNIGLYWLALITGEKVA